MEPDADLNFEKGDVIYENARVGEWKNSGKHPLSSSSACLQDSTFSKSIKAMEHHLCNGCPKTGIGSTFPVNSRMVVAGTPKASDIAMTMTI